MVTAPLDSLLLITLIAVSVPLLNDSQIMRGILKPSERAAGHLPGDSHSLFLDMDLERLLLDYKAFRYRYSKLSAPRFMGSNDALRIDRSNRIVTAAVFHMHIPQIVVLTETGERANFERERLVLRH